MHTYHIRIHIPGWLRKLLGKKEEPEYTSSSTSDIARPGFEELDKMGLLYHKGSDIMSGAINASGITSYYRGVPAFGPGKIIYVRNIEDIGHLETSYMDEYVPPLKPEDSPLGRLQKEMADKLKAEEKRIVKEYMERAKAQGVSAVDEGQQPPPEKQDGTPWDFHFPIFHMEENDATIRSSDTGKTDKEGSRGERGVGETDLRADCSCSTGPSECSGECNS